MNCSSVAMPTNDSDYCNNVLMEVCTCDVTALSNRYHGSWSIILLIMVLMVLLVLMLSSLWMMFP